ncbi:IS1 family transposase [Escherichia coli]|uniref:IS1 family transposase n=1 Tax=Escherichia coli TaxID=562 RepID=UPI00391F1F1A
MASVSISCPSCSATDGVVRLDKAVTPHPTSNARAGCLMRRWRVLSGLHRCEVLHPVGRIRRLRRIRHLTPKPVA